MLRRKPSDRRKISRQSGRADRTTKLKLCTAQVVVNICHAHVAPNASEHRVGKVLWPPPLLLLTPGALLLMLMRLPLLLLR